MTIIEKLERTVSLPILGADYSVANASLLEQFYALLIARLATAQAYTQLLQNNQALLSKSLAPDNLAPGNLVPDSLAPNDPTSKSLFENLWPDLQQRQLIIDELVATHHIDESSTIALVTSAASLAYHELKELANGQFLPAFLQQQQLEIRHYLPVWAESVLIDQTIIDEPIIEKKVKPAIEQDALNNTLITIATDDLDNQLASSLTDGSIDNTVSDSIDFNSVNTPVTGSSDLLTPAIILAKTSHADALQVSPAAYHGSKIITNRYTADTNRIHKTRLKNKKNDFLVRIFILFAAITALALLWLFVIQPRFMATIEPVVIAPVTVAQPSPMLAALTPASLTIAVDNSGRLYNCNATVGDISLQEKLKQALVASFADQATICEINIVKGVATTLADMNSPTLSNLLAILKSAPFARLQLQNNIITLEAPDSMVLQRLLTDTRTLLPAMTINTLDPLSVSNTNGSVEMTNLQGYNQTDSQQDVQINGQANNGTLNNQYNNSSSIDSNSDNNDSNYQAGVDDFNRNLENNRATRGSSLDRANDFSDANNTNNPLNLNTINNNLGSNNAGTNKRPTTGMSVSEVDDLANSVIVAEQLRNESRVEKNVATR